MKMAWGYIKSNIDAAAEEEQDNEDWLSVQYVKAWMELFVELNGHITTQWLTDTVIPTAKALIDLKKKITVRKHAVWLIVQMILRYEEDDIMNHFKGLILYWWQDLNWNIRLAIWEQFPKIWTKLSKENCIDFLYPEIVEFLNDVEILVRLTAIETVLEIFDILEDEQIENDFVPVVKTHLNLDIDDTCNHRMSKNIGKIVFNLQNSLDDSSGINEMCIEYFKNCLDMEGPDIKLNLCYNLPGLYYIFNSEDIDFESILEQFASDKDSTIRHQFAKCFHEIVCINSKGKGDSVELTSIFFNLLNDDDLEIQKTIISNLEEYLMNFFKYDEKDLTPNSRDSTGTDDEHERAKVEFFNQWIEYLIRVGDNLAIRDPKAAKPKLKGVAHQIPYSASSWRTKVMFYNKLNSTFDYFQQENIKAAFYDAAKQDFLYGTEPLRNVWAVFLAKVMYSECLEEDREQMLTDLINELKNGNFSQRRCLLQFYESSLKVFSKKYWIKYWYEGFWNMVKDPIPIIKIRFAKSAIKVWSYLTKKDTEISFIDEIDLLLEDENSDVQEAGVQLNNTVIKGHDKANERKLEEEEKAKLNYERLLKEREQRERDEIKRKKDEEKEKKEYMDMLTNQMRMKKRYLKLPGFQAKLFTKESSNSKARSRKRGSFTVATRSKTSKNGMTKKKSMSSNSSAGKIDSSTPNGQVRSLTYSAKDKKSYK